MFAYKIVAMLAVILSIAGCSKGPPQGIVSGKVTLDGQPLALGTVRFVPIDGNTATAGGEIKDGEYSVVAPVNKFNVVIHAADPSPPKRAPHQAMTADEPLAEELIPAKYNIRTELVVDVQDGQNRHDFPLTSR